MMPLKIWLKHTVLSFRTVSICILDPEEGAMKNAVVDPEEKRSRLQRDLKKTCSISIYLIIFYILLIKKNHNTR